MPRTARVVVAGAPHHVTQRGNRRQTTFFSDADYRLYHQIASEIFPASGVELWAYCLMPNHVHLVATPGRPEALARAVGATHLRYTRLVNRRERWTGFLWQGRFASFAMDEDYLRQCARYVGLNPVRAGLVTRARDWPWSSVQGHLTGVADPLLTAEPLARLRRGHAPVLRAGRGGRSLAQAALGLHLWAPAGRLRVGEGSRSQHGTLAPPARQDARHRARGRPRPERHSSHE